MTAASAPDSSHAKAPSRAAALRGDVVAGMTSGVLAVPQGIAFALIAHVPPVHGLYAMIVPTIVAAALRRSPFLVTGATNTSALVVGALVATLSAEPQDVVPMMLLITALMGLIQVSAAAFGLGAAFGRFVSQSVLVGFTFGAATLIFTDQLRNVLGVPVESSPRLVETMRNLLPHLSAADPRALAIAVATVAIIVGCTRLSKVLPGAMVALVVTAVAAWALGWTQPSASVPLVGEVARDLPRLTMPAVSLERIEAVLPASLAIAILGMVEAISIGKAVSASAGIRFHSNLELAAMGAGNVAGAFSGCMPTSASWTRSAIHLQMGARSRFAGIVSAGTVLAVMLVLAPAARYVPRATLGATIMWIAVLMIDLESARTVWRWSGTDRLVMVVTYVSTLLFPIQYAIYLGVVLSLLMLVARVGRLQMVEMVEIGPRLYREIDLDRETGTSALVLLAVEGDLFFGVVDELEEHLDRIADNGAPAIIIRMKRAHAIDATAAEALATFATQFQATGGRLMLCGLQPELHERVARSHLGEVLGADNVLATEVHHLGSMRRAIDKAEREILARGDLGDRPLVRRAPSESAERASDGI